MWGRAEIYGGIDKVPGARSKVKIQTKDEMRKLTFQKSSNILVMKSNDVTVTLEETRLRFGRGQISSAVLKNVYYRSILIDEGIGTGLSNVATVVRLLHTYKLKITHTCTSMYVSQRPSPIALRSRQYYSYNPHP
ncbi:uncharacterized protein LAJ45_02470 [Morchella importuna]|uniref:uncharacterized protein n=1 Tax=Morchella importuna TaxID=1174673 RepID=UPI001E8E3488|nr:uncharacterized protein LAJ45_02470 [Morchella importuna]KAH8153657.1 hypothetical protein LAJ45_02470 [Morchella importuna]